MKKILLATTVLASTASFAAADVAVTGSARMGIAQSRVGVVVAVPATAGPDGILGTADDTAAVAGNAGSVKSLFSSRVRIVFTGSGTTDGGLTFGASMRADQNGGNTSGTANGDSTVYISGAFGKLTMGDVAGGAGDELVGQISGVGYTGLGDTNEIGFGGNTATAARYDYTSGNLSFALGTSQTNAADGSDANSIAVKYATTMYNMAISYSTVKGSNLLSAKGGVTFGAATVTAKYAKAKATKADYGVSLDYAVSPALKVTAFFTDHKSLGTIAKGLGASYDLGGGASVIGGVINNGTDTLGDVGVTMSF